MRTSRTIIIASLLAFGAYVVPGCDEGGSKTEGPRPQSTTTPSAGSVEGEASSANTPAAPNPHGGGAGSNAGTHGAIQPDSATPKPGTSE